MEGRDLEVPKERLKVVLFADKDDYLRFIDRLGPDLSKASGFYDRKNNISVFYDQGTDESFESLYALNRVLQQEKERFKRERSPGTRDVVRLADTVQLLTEVSRENSDIEVVSHEATHQMAGNTGLMPPDAPVPIWAAEGLATYFESPKQAAWSGIGAVNRERLRWYRGLETDKEHSNIDFIISDHVFTFAASRGATLHAYGQAWALTHFLMAKHFDELFDWYMLIAKKKPKGKRLTDQETHRFIQSDLRQEPRRARPRMAAVHGFAQDRSGNRPGRSRLSLTCIMSPVSSRAARSVISQHVQHAPHIAD